jgi:hypothetical protein
MELIGAGAGIFAGAACTGGERCGHVA